MLEELWGMATGRWGLAALVLVALPGGRKALRTVAKEAIRAGVTVTEGAKDLYAEIKEEASDVVAEVQAERKQHHNDKHTTHKAHD